MRAMRSVFWACVFVVFFDYAIVLIPRPIVVASTLAMLASGMIVLLGEDDDDERR